VAPEDKFDRLQQLVEKGKEKGYAVYEDLDDALPADLGNGGELDGLLSGLNGSGMDLLEDPKLEFDQKLSEAEDLLDLDFGPAAAGEKTNDPVRTYLREMGTVPLLSREGEWEIARRIERGQRTVMKSISRSPLAIQEILDLAEEVQRGTLAPRDVVLVADPLIMDDAAEESGRELIVSTTERGLQFYTGNELEGVPGKGGVTYAKYAGLCVEAGGFPDQINMEDAETVVLRPNERYKQVTQYAMRVRSEVRSEVRPETSREQEQ